MQGIKGSNKQWRQIKKKHRSAIIAQSKSVRRFGGLEVLVTSQRPSLVSIKPASRRHSPLPLPPPPSPPHIPLLPLPMLPIAFTLPRLPPPLHFAPVPVATLLPPFRRVRGVEAWKVGLKGSRCAGPGGARRVWGPKEMEQDPPVCWAVCLPLPGGLDKGYGE